MSKKEWNLKLQELLNQCKAQLCSEEDDCTNSEKLIPPKKEGPPPGISQAYWKLQQRHFNRPPSPSEFRSTKFKIHEPPPPQKNSKTSPLPFSSSPKITPYSKLPLTRGLLLQHIHKWKKQAVDDLIEDINEEWEQTIRRPQEKPKPPKNFINLGCEQVRDLASVAPYAMSTIIRRFVTGPSNNSFFWLNRPQAVDCWQRIVTKERGIIDCCVFKPVESGKRRKPLIPALLKPHEKKKREEAPLGKIIPPFCEEMPPPELRMPWNISPLKPRKGGDGNRVSIKIQRELEMKDIISRDKDIDGEARNRQRFARTLNAREQLLNDFFERTKLSPVKLQSNRLRVTSSSQQLKRDVALSLLLSAEDY